MSVLALSIIAICILAPILMVMVNSIVTYKTITIKKRGGGTRKQRVMVLANGQYKFVKNTGSGAGTTAKGSKKKKKKSKSSSTGGTTTSNTKRKVLPEFPLYQIVAGFIILNGLSLNAIGTFLESIRTFIVYNLTFMSTQFPGGKGSLISASSPGFGLPGGGVGNYEYGDRLPGVVLNSTLKDDFLKLVISCMDAYRMANIRTTIWATVRAIAIVTAWTGGLKWANSKLPITIPKSIPIFGLFRIRVR